ncbi:transposase [Streptomyces sp. NPDC020719]|uniref:transposase n=1 Tax=Streptomyces sp. NPDC020719 TaxID=3154896 RepID=UPI0033CD5C56
MTDEQWLCLAAVLPPLPQMGRKPREGRQVLDGNWRRVRTGSPWRGVPDRYGPWGGAGYPPGMGAGAWVGRSGRWPGLGSARLGMKSATGTRMCRLVRFTLAARAAGSRDVRLPCLLPARPMLLYPVPHSRGGSGQLLARSGNRTFRPISTRRAVAAETNADGHMELFGVNGAGTSTTAGRPSPRTSPGRTGNSWTAP